MEGQARPRTPADVLVITSERFADHHVPAGHPERVERAEVMTAVAERWQAQGGATAEPSPATDDDLARVHAAAYLEDVAATRGRSVRLDPDTYASPESEAVARLAAGAVLRAVDHAIEGNGAAMALVRPPGHHAERERAMGFCLYNNVAIGAAHARRRGVASVAIVDYDVHHGNGTQWTFYDDPTVLFASTHQYPFYPGTGALEDVGTGPGAGFTLNVALEAGAGDADYDLVFRAAVLPVLEAFAPELVMISAGYDAHARDPLGGMQVSTAGYRRLTTMLRRFADARCQGRLVAVTEGGYDRAALEACLVDTLEALSEPSPAAPSPVPGPAPRAEASLEGVRRAQRRFWPTL